MFLSSLPNEVVFTILTYLDVADLICVAKADPNYTSITNKLIRQYTLKVHPRTLLLSYFPPSHFRWPFSNRAGHRYCDEQLETLAADGIKSRDQGADNIQGIHKHHSLII